MEQTNLQQVALALSELGIAPVPQQVSYAALLSALEHRINTLINEDFSSLIQLLYQMDVPEKELRKTLESSAGKNAAGAIAAMMIRRLLQKIESRKAFKKKDDIPEEDKW